MLKKTTLAVLGLISINLANAGTMGPICAPGNVTVPCEASQWDLGIQALYLKTLFNADKVYQRIVDPLNIAPDGYGLVNNKWDWGFRLEGSYHFNTGNDVTLNWMHFKNNATQPGFVGQFILSFPIEVTLPYTVVSKNQFDQVNLVLGQHVDLSPVNKLRFYGGMQYANIQADITNYSNGTTADLIAGGITSENRIENTDFKGFGPAAGIDYSYFLTEGLSLTANGAGSILYGTSRIYSAYVTLPANQTLQSIYGTRKIIVPSLEAKLGLNYGYHMAQGVLNLEGGYQAVNYFRAVQATGINGFAGGKLTDSDFGLYGPYLGLKYVGNV